MFMSIGVLCLLRAIVAGPFDPLWVVFIYTDSRLNYVSITFLNDQHEKNDFVIQKMFYVNYVIEFGK